MRALLGALLGLALSGCSALDPLPAEIHVPLPTSSAPAPAARAAGVWRVAPYTAASLYRERAMVYSEDGGATLRQHPYQFWLDSPAVLCREALLETLRAMGIATRVVATADAGATLEIQGRVLAFDRLVDGATSTVRVVLEFEVLDTDRREVRIGRRYEEVQPAADNDARGTAAAAAAALAAIHRRFIADTRAALALR